MNTLLRNSKILTISTIIFLITIILPTKILQSSTTNKQQIIFSDSSNKEITWYDFSKTESLSKENKKKIMVSLYTDWCGWCKKMDKETFTDKRIINLANDNFYSIKFNAEQKENVLFMEKEFKYIAQYKTHEIAIALTGGELSYPSTIILDENFEFIDRIPGYVTADAMADILEYFGKDIYKTTKWDVYKKSKAKN